MERGGEALGEETGGAPQDLVAFGRTWEPSQHHKTKDGHDLIYHLKGSFWLLKVSFPQLGFYQDQC